MNRINYQKKMEEMLAEIRKTGEVPRLLLHSCCAPCSSRCLEVLSEHFLITDYYYNPNITDEEEYRKRAEELQRLIGAMPFPHEVTYAEGPFEPEAFFRAAEGLEEEPEGGRRCCACFRLRLFEAARFAAEAGIPYLTTSLTISPLKDAQLLNTIGEEAAERFGITWLPSDFKKKDGYRRSVALSEEYGLYRQNYCGCIFSKRRDCVIVRN